VNANRPTRATTDGRVYLDLQNLARHDHRPTDEYVQLYALEGMLARLTSSDHADKFVLKGGALLAAYQARRPTRDIDFAATGMANEAAAVLQTIRQIAQIPMDDGLHDFPQLAQNRWSAWRRRQDLAKTPADFADLLTAVIAFADPAITGDAKDKNWDAAASIWQ
jgi:hypothetical protein